MTNIFKVLAKVALLIGLAVAPVYAQNTITVTTVENTVGASAVDASSFVRYRLRNYAGFVPQVSGVSIISQTQIDTPVISGATSQVIYKNSVISPASTFYTIEHWTGGKMTSSANYLCSASGDISVACSLVLTPPVPSLPSDLVYARLSGSNTPFTGNIKFSAGLDLNNSGAGGTPLAGAIRLSRDSTSGFLSCINSAGKSCIPSSGVTCLLTGDGVTSDLAALNACINVNQGRHIFLPKTQPVGSCDYNINGGTLLLKGHGQILEGEGAGWGGAASNTTICKTVEDGLPGIDIIHANCQNCTIKNMHITGPSPWTSSTLTQNIPPCSPPEGITYAVGVTCINGGDGIKVEAGFTTLENVYVENWGHHGIYTTSEFGGFPDNIHYINVTSNNNRGDGYYCKGGDCNAGSTLQFHAYTNQMYGMDEHSFLGNSHYSPQMTANHPAGTTTGSTFASTATRTGNVVTLTATGHNFSVGNVIVVAGMSDSTFNGTFSLSAVTANTATYPQTAANSSATGGTARLTSNNEYYAFTLLTGGAYNNVGASAWNTYYSPYCEGSQNPFKSGNKTVIIGGDQGCGIDYTNSPLVIGNGVANSGFAGPNILTGASGVAQGTPTDNAVLFNWFAGKTVDQSIQQRFSGGQSGHNYWEWVHNVGGTPGGTTSTLTLWREGNGQKARLSFLAPAVGGQTLINDEGSSTRLNNSLMSSGEFEIMSGGFGPGAPSRIYYYQRTGEFDLTPNTNGIDILTIKRFTDTSPTANFLNFKNAAAAPLFQVDITGKIALEQGIPTVGIGTPVVVATATQTGQTGLIGSTSILTSAPIGFYRINRYLASTTSCATPGPAQVSLLIGWTSENSASETATLSMNLGNNTIGNTTANSSTGTTTFWVNSISNITYQTTYTACTSGTGTYNLRLVLERIN